jgi:hypothetical protein
MRIHNASDFNRGQSFLDISKTNFSSAIFNEVEGTLRNQTMWMRREEGSMVLGFAANANGMSVSCWQLNQTSSVLSSWRSRTFSLAWSGVRV